VAAVEYGLLVNDIMYGVGKVKRRAVIITLFFYKSENAAAFIITT
jgi:hypothetical protein